MDTTCPECYGTGFYHGIGAPCDCVGVTAVTLTQVSRPPNLVNRFEDLKVGMKVKISWDALWKSGIIRELGGSHIYLDTEPCGYYTWNPATTTVEILP